MYSSKEIFDQEELRLQREKLKSLLPPKQQTELKDGYAEIFDVWAGDSIYMRPPRRRMGLLGELAATAFRKKPEQVKITTRQTGLGRIPVRGLSQSLIPRLSIVEKTYLPLNPRYENTPSIDQTRAIFRCYARDDIEGYHYESGLEVRFTEVMHGVVSSGLITAHTGHHLSQDGRPSISTTKEWVSFLEEHNIETADAGFRQLPKLLDVMIQEAS